MIENKKVNISYIKKYLFFNFFSRTIAWKYINKKADD